MKKIIKILCTAAVMGCLTAFPSWAAETKAEYKEEIAPVRAELKALESEMKPIREENKASAARYKSVRLSKKETGSLSVSKEKSKGTSQSDHGDPQRYGQIHRQRLKTADKNRC